MASDQGEQPQQIRMEMVGPSTIIFKVRDGVTVEAEYASEKQLKVRAWRDAKGYPLLPPMPPLTGNMYTKSFREQIAESAREHFNTSAEESEEQKDTVPNILEDLGNIATLLQGKVAGDKSLQDLLKEEAGSSLAERLVDLVEAAGELLVTPEGRPHVALTVDDHTEVYSLNDDRFETWLRGHFYATERQRLRDQAVKAHEQMQAQMGALAPSNYDEIKVSRPPLLKPQVMTDALAQLKSVAVYQKRVEEVSIRVAGHKGRYYIDLCSDEHEVVEVDAEGWRIIQNPPVYFVRAAGMLELPRPERGGSLDDLRSLINVGDDEESQRNWVLIISWLIQALRPHPQHPVLALKGGEGTAKSTTARFLRGLVDPSVAPEDSAPPDLRTLCIMADATWCLSFDNLSSISDWFSDALAKLVTGSALRVRSLYTDRGLEIFRARRPVVLNGIPDLAKNSDLLSRTLLVTLPVIQKYRLELEVEEEYESKRSGILGALLDAMSAGLAKLPNIPVEGRGTRLPDFDRWARACEVALGFDEGAFSEARQLSEGEAVQQALEADPFMATVEKFAARYKEENPYVGTPTELLETLTNFETDDDAKRSSFWPSSATALGSRLARNASSLRVEGVYAERSKATKGKRGWKLYYKPKDDQRVDGGTSDEEGATEGATSENPTDKPNPEGSGTSGTSGTFHSELAEDDLGDEEEGEV